QCRSHRRAPRAATRATPRATGLRRGRSPPAPSWRRVRAPLPSRRRRGSSHRSRAHPGLSCRPWTDRALPPLGRIDNGSPSWRSSTSWDRSRRRQESGAWAPGAPLGWDSRLVVLLTGITVALADLPGRLGSAGTEQAHLGLELEQLLIGRTVILKLLEFARQLVATEFFLQLRSRECLALTGLDLLLHPLE